MARFFIWVDWGARLEEFGLWFCCLICFLWLCYDPAFAVGSKFLKVRGGQAFVFFKCLYKVA